MYLARGLRWLTDELGLTENIQEYRTTVGDELIRAGHIPNPTDSPWKINRDIARAKERAQSTILEDIGFLLGLVPALLMLGRINLGLGIQLAGILLSIVMLARAVMIGILAFDPPPGRVPPQRHEFMRAWNQGPLQGYVAKIGLPFVALVMQLHRPGYELGLWIMRVYAEEKL